MDEPSDRAGAVAREPDGVQIAVSRSFCLTLTLELTRTVEDCVRLTDAGGDARQPALQVRVLAAVGW
ncbi:hypothetical protein IPZ61_17205 [Streptomyces sioyaensis]|uniref:hypothetical protein n=1 Tax=Streptomyces sioyaensis TaxID=67364 RepID=UPI001F185D5D|nr:hypothetical protein [Streptomyces sioyaensis]MCF3175049.1 hypothetical protein [Streptomyces sioyaensis]